MIFDQCAFCNAGLMVCDFCEEIYCPECDWDAHDENACVDSEEEEDHD